MAEITLFCPFPMVLVVYHALNNKSQTFTVESVNADLRHYIPPLHRKSRCFFRSFDTIFAVFKIFVLAKLRFNYLKHHLDLSSFLP